MNLAAGVAGLICVGLACGHMTVGVVWLLPGLTEERLPSTPFGPPALSVGMVRVTWHIVTIFCLALGGLLLSLAWDAHADAKTLLLRWFAAMFLAATAMVFGVARGGLRSMLRFPVWSLWVAVAVLYWRASM